MMLISCHIENFGKLTDRTVSFVNPDGMKVICENNGWGKSTLATFIKVMFYGFDNEGRRNEIENERQHYRPWQGGVYGGQLTFEADGRTYIISRTFGSKEKDDKFILQDADTMLETADYSSNIGEELFQIDRASFLRSIYISQNDCITTTTDKINAKLGNLTDNTNDLNNYETADKKIDEMLNSLSKSRKTGILYKQKEQIATLKQEIKNGEAIDVSMEELSRLKSDLLGVYMSLKEEQGILQKKQKAVSEYKDIAVKKKEYDSLCKLECQKQSEFEHAKAFFPEKIPTADEVNEYISIENNAAGLKKELDIYKLEGNEESELTELETRFSSGVPDKGEIEKQNINVNEMQTLGRDIEKSMLTDEEQKSLAHFEDIFSDGMPAWETIDKLSNSWAVRTEKKNTLSSKRATADMLEMTAKAAKEAEEARKAEEAAKAEAAANEKRTKEKRRRTLDMGLILAVTGLITAVAGVLINFMLSLIAGGAVILTVGIVTMLMSLFINSGDAKKVLSQEHMPTTTYVTTDSNDSNSVKPDSNEPYQALRQEIAGDEELILRIESEVQQFLTKYGFDFDENSIVADLYQLKENVKQYERLTEKQKNSDTERMQENYKILRDTVEAFLQKYGYGSHGFDSDGQNRLSQYINALHRLENSIDRYFSLKDKNEKYKTAYEAYEKNVEDIRAFICGLKMPPMQELRLQLQNIKDALREYDNTWNECEKARKAKQEFEEKNADIIEDIKKAEEREADSSLSDIEARLSEISEELEKNHTSMSSYDHQLEQLQESKDAITDSEKELAELQELYAHNEKKYETLKNTQKYLEQAKISLTAKYTKPIKDGFDKYFRLLAGIESENYQMDANLEMSVKEQGMPRKIEFLSTGYQDMVGICMRMALIDAMYKEEKPFVIFDDPFVNLDDTKTKGALKLLDMIAGEYQVVYFTCNGSRK
ncbi:MAG: AAA family ATPase [Lachnospiraceae bacterium]|nr:AAA family ATPase [Lachnospiraceae bacterium]